MKVADSGQNPARLLTGLLTGLAGVALVALLDWQTGTEISLSILYLLPIGLAVWFAGKWAGVGTSLVAAGTWLLLDLRGGAVYSHFFIPYWNALVRLGFFLLTAFLLNRVRTLTWNLEGLIAKRTAALVSEVDQRKQAEEVVRESEIRFRQLAENIKEVFWMSDLASSQILYVSPGYEEIWGQSCASLYAASRNWLDAIHPEDREHVSAAALTKQVSGQYEEVYRIVRSDGSIRWIQDRAFPVQDESGKVYRIVGIAEDITGRKRADEQRDVFATLGHKLSAAAQPTAAAQIIMDMASQLFGWDAGYLHLYSSAEDLIIPILTVDTVDGQRTPVPDSSFTLDPSPLMRRVMDAGAELINRPDAPPSVPLEPFGDVDRPSASMMYVPIHSSRTVLGVLSIQSYTFEAYSPDDLKLLQALADHCGDALERIRLASATRELASIVQNSGDAIVSTTLDGAILSWNKGAERLYGYAPEEIKGRPISLLFPPEWQADLPDILSRIGQGQRTDNLETTRRKKNGTLMDVSLTVSPIRDEAGRITGASVIERDITERKRLEREIAAISQHEQQRLAHDLHDHLGAYLAGIAFRVKALAEGLERRGVPEAQEALKLVGLVNEGADQVRNFARLLAPVEVENGGLEAALSRLAAEMESLFGIECRVEVAGDLPPLTNEQGLQLYRIAQESVRNAVQHGKARQIEISVTHAPGRLIQTVRNDGQVWDASQPPTNSLGVRIMHYRAGTLGGTLTLESACDGRTTVVCQAPIPLAVRSESRDHVPDLAIPDS